MKSPYSLNIAPALSLISSQARLMCGVSDYEAAGYGDVEDIEEAEETE